MRDDGERLRDMLEAIARIERYAACGRERFEADELVQTWFIQNLQVLGEAARSLSQETRDRAPAIPWRQMIGMWNVLAHTYFNIDLDAVWSAVADTVPLLKAPIVELLQQLS